MTLVSSWVAVQTDGLLRPRLTMTPRIALPTLLATLAACALAAAPASASRNQTTFFEAPAELKSPTLMPSALGDMESLGVRAVRQVLYWRDVAPSADSRIKPDFDTTDPAAYDWSKYDALVDAVKARGWKMLLTVSGPVPRWATEGRSDQVTRPDDSEFAQFVTALARHYGTKVDLWSIWNEPNQPQFLKPQYDSKHRPASPRIYRALYRAALKGFAAGGLAKPVVLLGETSPRGTGKVVAPLTFLRGTLCLSTSYRRSKGCGPLATAGYAHHAYTTRQGPFFKPSGKNDVTIGVLSRLTTALDRAGRAGAIPKGLDVYLTEFGIQSTPDPLYGVPQQQQAEYRAISERIAYDNRRVVSFSQYLLRDDQPVPGVPALARYSGFESGLRTAAGKPKVAFDAFRLTLAVRRTSSSRGSAWGLVRPATGPVTATLQYRSSSKGTFRNYKTVRTNRLGYFTTSVVLRKGRQFRLTWNDATGKTLAGGPTRAYAK